MRYEKVTSFSFGLSDSILLMEIIENLQWFINSSRQTEGRLYTQARARKMVDLLCREGVDCVIVTHGYFMHTLLQEMKRTGFMVDNSHASYHNGEYVIAER